MANNTTVPVTTPLSVTVTAASAQALDTAVKAQVNTLIQASLNPKNTGNAAGTVINGTIVVSESGLSLTAEGIPTWFATVRWQGSVVPS